MDKIKSKLNDALSKHLKNKVTNLDILQGDKELFLTLFKSDLNIKELEEVSNFLLNKLYEELNDRIQKEKITVDFNFKNISNEEIDVKINEFIGNFQCNFVRQELMVLNSGKKKLLRGKMALKLQNNSEYELPAAIEMFHLASLIQDDIIDKAKYRRFKETLNYKYSNEIALLVSDILFIEVIFSLKKYIKNKTDKLKLSQADKNKLVKYLEDIFYNLIVKMLESEKLANHVTTNEEYDKYAAYKTANLFSAALVTAFISNIDKEVDYEKFNDVYEFGQKFGILFQKVDDLLDYENNFEESGKDGNDLENNINNFVYLNLDKYTYEEIKNLLKSQYEEVKQGKISKIYDDELKILYRRIYE